jgi:hypothetical protein
MRFGVEAHVCVLQSALDALSLGLGITHIAGREANLAHGANTLGGDQPILEGASIDESGLAQVFRRNRVYQGISEPLII